MAIYGAYSSSMLGMMSQAKTLHNIGVNVANVNTGGFKRTDTQFSTVLSRSMQNVSDNGGVRPNDKYTVDQQGIIVSSANSTDVAISGKGFFMMNTAQDGSGGVLYGRDGSFEIQTANDISVTGIGGQTVTTKDGYLADKNGYFIQGWAYQNGAVTTSSTPESLRVDQYAFIDQFEPTTTADIGLNLPAGDAVGSINPFDLSIFDSLGAQQSVKLNFTKTGTLAWDVSTTTSRTPVAQVDTITLGGTAGEAGDIYTANVNGNSVIYTTTGAETSIDDIRDGLMAMIAGDSQIAANATAAAGATGEILITAVTAGNPLTTTATATQGPVVNVAQADTVTLAGGVGLGDIYSVTINGITLSATAGGAVPLATLRDDLLGQINAHATLGPLVTATVNGVDGMNIVSDTAGVAYTVTASATDVAAFGAANTNTAASVTANVTALADNTTAVAITTANVTDTVTSATTAVTFNSDGTVNTPTTLNLALTFNGGSTATVALDISNVTQFYGEFLPISSSKNGFASSSMRSFNFNANGDVIGTFEDNTNRTIYKLALAVFSNPNALEATNGNVYKPSNDSGAATITTAGSSGYASITPNARELSNVDLAAEFSKMMMTQTAYNAASKVFQTADEMTIVARDLKR